jgi:hypothetical protein
MPKSQILFKIMEIMKLERYTEALNSIKPGKNQPK